MGLKGGGRRTKNNGGRSPLTTHLMKKLIRVTALSHFRSADQSEAEQMKLFEEKKPKIRVKYEKSNAMDPTAVIVMMGTKKIGYVDAEDKRWIAPLLNENGTKGVKLTFDHVVYASGKGSACLKYAIEVEKPMAKARIEDSCWIGFAYNHPLIDLTDEYDNIDNASTALLSILSGEEEFSDLTLMDCVSMIRENCLYDFSLETTDIINECCFALEMKGTAESYYLQELLEEGSALRRSHKYEENRKQFFASLFESNRAEKLFNVNKANVKRANGLTRISQKLMKEDLMKLEKELLTLPRELYTLIDNPVQLFHASFYTGLPREKQHELMSALVLRRKLMDYLHIEPSAEEEVANEEIEIKSIDFDWLVEWTKGTKDKNIADVISKMVMAYKIHLSDDDLSKRLEEMSASCVDQTVFNIGKADNVIANVETMIKE